MRVDVTTFDRAWGNRRRDVGTEEGSIAAAFR